MPARMSGVSVRAIVQTPPLASGRVPFGASDGSGQLAHEAALAYDPATDTLTAGVVKGSGLTAGRVALSGAAGVITDDAGLTYDTATDALTIAGSMIVSGGAAGQAIQATTGPIRSDYAGTAFNAPNGGATFGGATVRVDGVLDHNGATVGFYGVTPATRPGATAEIKAGLASLGILTDGGATPLDLDGGSLTAANAVLSGYVERVEIADPSAPAANAGLVYLRDVAGKTQLAARFATGAIKPIVEQPTTVQTTDATVTTLLAYTPTDAKTTLIVALVAARSSVPTGASYIRRFTVRRAGGTVTAISTVETIGSDDEDTAAWDATLDISGTTVRVRVTGAAATTIDWCCDLWLLESG